MVCFILISKYERETCGCGRRKDKHRYQTEGLGNIKWNYLKHATSESNPPHGHLPSNNAWVMKTTY